MKETQMKTVIGGLVGLGIVFFAASWYVSEQQSEYVSQLRVNIAEQETTLATLAQIIDQDGADAVVASLIVDCEPDNRTRFDTLLSELDSLTLSELREVDSLFDACGDYFAQRRAVMVARLEREYEVYADYVQLLEVTDPRAPIAEYNIATWSEIVAMESERSDLSLSLVRIQEEIIAALLEGSSPTDEDIQLKVAEAGQARDSLSVLGIRIDTQRSEVIGL